MLTAISYKTLSALNFFFLAMALFWVFIYATRLKFVLQRSTTLRKAAQKFQVLFQSTSEGVFRCGRDGKLLIINLAGARILGYPDDQSPVTEGVNLARFFADREQARQLTHRLEDRGRVNSRVVDVQTLDGISISVEVSMHLQQEEGVEIYEGIFRDVSQRIQLERELQSYRVHLEHLVKARTAELEAMNQRLRRHEVQLKNLSRQQAQIQENERKRIAHELHDEAGQLLSAVKIDLDLLQNALDQNPDPLVKQKLEDAAAITERLMTSVHEMALDLRPAILDDLGLVPALNWFIRRFENRSGLPVAFQTEGLERRLPSALETQVYRIIQEALNNTAKHAQAASVHVRLSLGESLALHIEDDGMGFDAEAVFDTHRNTDRMGLIGMRERVLSLGGQFNLESRAGVGTRIDIAIPLGDEA